MSGYVPKRVRTQRTAMGSTDANSSGMNGHSIVSSIGRRSTLLRNIKTRSFGSMWQIDYQNAVDTGAKCTMETLLPQKDYSEMTIPINTDVDVTLFRDGNTSGPANNTGVAPSFSIVLPPNPGILIFNPW